MKLADVHCHLESRRFDGDRENVVRRFEKVGGRFMICSGTSFDNNRKVLELSRRFGVVRASFGLYTVGNLSGDVDSELRWIEEHVEDCVAVGECGFDFDGEDSRVQFERQKVLFEKQIDLALKLRKPLVVHSRKAEVEAVDILEAKGARDVVMHCFCGKKALIKRGIENGWYFSVPPAILRWDNFKMLVDMVPLNQLLTETDAPYLGPVARERNESANVVVALREIARIKGMSVEDVADRVWKNFEKVFGLGSVY